MSDEGFGGIMSYMSHLEEKNDNECCSFFTVNGKMYYQNSSGTICNSQFGNQRNIVMLAVRISLSDYT